MGIGVYPVFNPPVAAARFDCDSKALFYEARSLDQIAVARGLPAFTSFGDNRDVPEGFDGDPAELNELLRPRDQDRRVARFAGRW